MKLYKSHPHILYKLTDRDSGIQDAHVSDARCNRLTKVFTRTQLEVYKLFLDRDFYYYFSLKEPNKTSKSAFSLEEHFLSLMGSKQLKSRNVLHVSTQTQT